MPRGKSDVYVSSRRVANSVKVSLHEPGPARFALTSEFVRRGDYRPPEDRHPRLAVEWERPRPKPPRSAARPLTILVPWDEVRHQTYEETGDIIWVPPPPEGTCIHFDVVYTPAGVEVIGHPGARSMGTRLVGDLELANSERVFVTALVREIDAPLAANIERLRSVRVVDAEGNLVKTGMLGFGHEPNPDADDGTFVGSVIDVTRPDEL